MLEEWKWRGVPVWSHAGILCTGETYRSVVKFTFASGAALPEPPASSTPASKVRRAVDSAKAIAYVLASSDGTAASLIASLPAEPLADFSCGTLRSFSERRS